MSDSFYHGVTVSLVDDGARTIAVPSSSIIGLVDTYNPAEGQVAPHTPTKITSLTDGIQKFGPKSAIAARLREIYTQAKTACVVIGVPETTDASALTSAIIGGVTAKGERTGAQALLDAKPLFDLTPRLLAAPGHTRTQAVASAVESIAQKLRSIAIVDGPNTDDDAVLAYAKNFGSKRIYMVDPGAKVYDTNANSEIIVPASAAVAGLFAKTDSEIGFWASPSNHEFSEVLGTGRPIEYLDGDASCRANLLNASKVATIIRDGGYRLWGNRTLSADPKWSFVTRVRSVDIVMDAILAGHKWATDRGITKTYVKDVTDGLSHFMRDLKKQGAVIDFEVYADPDRNTESQLAQGRVFWRIRFTDVIPAENPTFLVEVTDQWITEVLTDN